MDPQQNENGLLGPDDYQTILALIKAQDPRGMKLAATLSPDEKQAFFDFQKQANKGINPAASPDRNLATGIPFIGSMDPADVVPVGLMGKNTIKMGGQALRGFAESPDGFWQGVKGALKGILPTATETAPAAGAETVEASAPKFTRTMPESDAAYEAASGKPRLSIRKPEIDSRISGLAEDANGVTPKPNGGNGDARFEELLKKFGGNGKESAGKLGGPDTAGLRSQPNVNLRRTVGDVREQVGRGVNGVNAWEDSRSIPLNYGNTPENEQSVEAIMAKLAALLGARK